VAGFVMKKRPQCLGEITGLTFVTVCKAVSLLHKVRIFSAYYRLRLWQSDFVTPLISTLK